MDILPSNPGVADMSAVDLSDNNTMTPRSSRKKELPEEGETYGSFFYLGFQDVAFLPSRASFPPHFLKLW